VILNVPSISAGGKITGPAYLYFTKKNLLFPDGHIFKKDDIELLKSWGIPCIYVEGDFVSGAEDLIKPGPFGDDKIDSLRTTFEKLNKGLMSIYQDAALGKPYDDTLFHAELFRIPAKIREFTNPALAYVMESTGRGHASQRPSFGILVGITAGAMAYLNNMQESKISLLLYAACLMDISFTEINEEILEKSGPLDDEELNLVHRHPLVSIKTLSEKGKFPPDVLRGVVDHHEAFDGSGYPQSKKGENIDILGRYLHLASAWVSNLEDRSYRTSLSPEKVLQKLQHERHFFDPEIFSALEELYSPVPPGTVITMKDRSVAAVLSKKHGTTPVLLAKILKDSFGEQPEKPKMIEIRLDRIDSEIAEFAHPRASGFSRIVDIYKAGVSAL